MNVIVAVDENWGIGYQGELLVAPVSAEGFGYGLPFGIFERGGSPAAILLLHGGAENFIGRIVAAGWKFGQKCPRVIPGGCVLRRIEDGFQFGDFAFQGIQGLP